MEEQHMCEILGFPRIMKKSKGFPEHMELQTCVCQTSEMRRESTGMPIIHLLRHAGMVKIGFKFSDSIAAAITSPRGPSLMLETMVAITEENRQKRSGKELQGSDFLNAAIKFNTQWSRRAWYVPLYFLARAYGFTAAVHCADRDGSDHVWTVPFNTPPEKIDINFFYYVWKQTRDVPHVQLVLIKKVGSDPPIYVGKNWHMLTAAGEAILPIDVEGPSGTVLDPVPVLDDDVEAAQQEQLRSNVQVKVKRVREGATGKEDEPPAKKGLKQGARKTTQSPALFQQRIAEQDDHIRQLENDLKAARERAEQLDEELEGYTAQLVDRKKTISEQKRTISAQKNTIEQLKQVPKQPASNVQALRIKALESKINGMKRKHTMLLTAQRRKTSDATDQIKKLDKELTEVKTVLVATKTVHTDLQGQLKSSQNTITLLNEAHDKEVKELKQRVLSEMTWDDLSVEQRRALGVQLRSVLTQDHAKEIEAAKEKVKEDRKKIESSLRQSVATLTAEITRLTSAAAGSPDAEKQGLLVKIQETEKANAELRKKLEKSAAQREYWLKKAKELEVAATSQLADLDESRAENILAADEMQDLQDEVKESKAKIEELKAELQSASDLVELAESEESRAKEKLRKLEASVGKAVQYLSDATGEINAAASVLGLEANHKETQYEEPAAPHPAPTPPGPPTPPAPPAPGPKPPKPSQPKKDAVPQKPDFSTPKKPKESEQRDEDDNPDLFDDSEPIPPSEDENNRPKPRRSLRKPKRRPQPEPEPEPQPESEHEQEPEEEEETEQEDTQEDTESEQEDGESERPPKRQTVRRNQPQKCSICKESFKGEGQLKRHQVEAHPGEFKCPVCKAKKSSESVLRRHMRRHEAISTKQFVCPTCDKCFATHDGLTQHAMTHVPPELKIRCVVPGCTARFSHAKHQKRHMKERHTDDAKPARCMIDGCSKYLSSQRSVKDHVRAAHKGRAPLWCFDSTFQRNREALDNMVPDEDDETRLRSPPRDSDN